MDIINLILTIGLFIIAFAVSWLGLSSYRFQVYLLYDSIEEALRRFSSHLNLLELTTTVDTSEDIQRRLISTMSDVAIQNLSGCIFAYGGKEIHVLSMALSRLKGTDVIDEADMQTLRNGITKADRLLGACRDEKHRLDGWFKGNCWALRLLCQKSPVNVSFIMRTVSRRADDLSENITWRGVER